MAKEKEESGGMSDEELIGFHKGALSTLASERAELIRLVQITEELIKTHAKELENLGVDLKKQN